MKPQSPHAWSGAEQLFSPLSHALLCLFLQAPSVPTWQHTHPYTLFTHWHCDWLCNAYKINLIPSRSSRDWYGTRSHSGKTVKLQILSCIFTWDGKKLRCYPSSPGALSSVISQTWFPLPRMQVCTALHTKQPSMYCLTTSLVILPNLLPKFTHRCVLSSQLACHLFLNRGSGAAGVALGHETHAGFSILIFFSWS